jgi:glycosyltransferase involved in cell wall biosynthesis
MADVFVFPSQWETFGLVMIEAMACGTPVAAFPVQGPLDVVDEGVTGCLNEDLKQAVTDCLFLPRHKVHDGSQRWSWERAWQIFRDNLIPVKN